MISSSPGSFFLFECLWWTSKDANKRNFFILFFQMSRNHQNQEVINLKRKVSFCFSIVHFRWYSSFFPFFSFFVSWYFFKKPSNLRIPKPPINKPLSKAALNLQFLEFDCPRYVYVFRVNTYQLMWRQKRKHSLRTNEERWHRRATNGLKWFTFSS